MVLGVLHRRLCSAATTTTTETIKTLAVRVLRRHLSSSTDGKKDHHVAWALKNVTQVTKANFRESLSNLKELIKGCEFVAISTLRTGGTTSSSSSSTTRWSGVLPYLDTTETAYLKTRHAADKFQIHQFSVCPLFSNTPEATYNFHLYPMDESNTGIPSYNFSCKKSYLTSMAQQGGLDLNKCISDGIPCVSRVLRDSAPKEQLGKSPSESDTIFVERVESQIQHWKNTCSDDIHSSVVLASCRAEDASVVGDQNGELGGFHEVIDVISSCQKPIVAYNCLEEFAFIHSKFIAPLPPSMDEFMSSLRAVFPQILDVGYLLKKTVLFKKAIDIQTVVSHTKRKFLDRGTPPQAEETENCGQNALFAAYLFDKLRSIKKLDQKLSMNRFANMLSPCSPDPQEPSDERNCVWMNNTRQVKTSKLILLWGFQRGLSAGTLKVLLQDTHSVFSSDFEVRLVDKRCAVVSVKDCKSRKKFLKDMNSDSVKYLKSKGIRATGHEAYVEICSSLGFPETDLADLLEKVHDQERAKHGTVAERVKSWLFGENDEGSEPSRSASCDSFDVEEAMGFLAFWSFFAAFGYYIVPVLFTLVYYMMVGSMWIVGCVFCLSLLTFLIP